MCFFPSLSSPEPSAKRHGSVDVQSGDQQSEVIHSGVCRSSKVANFDLNACPGLTSGSLLPVWMCSKTIGVKGESVDHLKENITRGCDVCVIGGGLTGLSVAYELVKSGKKVTVIEDGRIASGETGRSEGNLTSARRYDAIIRQYGKETARLYHQALTASLDRVQEICETVTHNTQQPLTPTPTLTRQLLLGLASHLFPSLLCSLICFFRHRSMSSRLDCDMVLTRGDSYLALLGFALASLFSFALSCDAMRCDVI